MTQEFVYWVSPLKDTFNVMLKSCIETEDGYEIEIDKQVIRPEGGGQAGDKGTILTNTIEIPFFNTIEKDGKVLVIAEKPIDAPTKAKIKLDLSWRRGMMRNHSAEHLFVSQIKRIHDGAELGYIWIDGEQGTVDVHGENITIDEVLEAERGVQKIIAEDIPMKSRFVSADKLDESIRAREGVKRKQEQIRVVSFGEYDSSACSGTHVLTTGDIGLFKVVNCKLHDIFVRVEFLTGDRAVKVVSEVFNMALTRKETYPFELEQLGTVLDKSKRILTERNLLVKKVEELILARPTAETVSGIEFIAEFLPGFEAKDLRRLIKRMRFVKKMAVFLFAPSEKPNFVFAVNKLPKPASDYVKDIVETLGGRGGGSREVFTGGFSTVQDPDALFQSLKEKIRRRLAS